MQSFSPSPGEPGYRGASGPVWSEGRLTEPSASAARHLCHRIISSPPTEGGALGPVHIKIILGAAAAGLALMEKQAEQIARIESLGTPWRLRVPIKTPAQVGLKDEPTRYNEVVSELVALGWLIIAGGGHPKQAPQFELGDPR